MKTSQYSEVLSWLARSLMIFSFLAIFIILAFLRSGVFLLQRSPLWLILIFLVFIQTILSILSRKRDVVRTPLDLPILLLCIVYGSAIFYSYTPEKSWLEFNNVLVYALAFFFISHVIQDRIDVHLFTYGIVFIGLILALQSLYSLIFKVPGAVFIEEARIRLLGTFGYANIFGIFLAMILPLALHLAITSKSQWTESLMACTANILLLTIMMTYSRGAILTIFGVISSLIIISSSGDRFRCTTDTISFVIPAMLFSRKVSQSAFFIATSTSRLDYQFALLSFFLLIFGSLLSTLLSIVVSRKIRNSSSYVIKGLISILAVNLIVFAVFAISSAISRRPFDLEQKEVERFIDRNRCIGNEPKQQLQAENLLSLANQQQPQIRDRLSLWSLSIESIKENPLWGTGPGTFYLNFLARRRQPRIAVDPHNLYLRLLSELGILGFLPFAIIVAWCIFLMVSLLNKKIKMETNSPIPTYVAGVLGFLVHSSIDMEWIFPAVILLFFSYLGFVYSKYNIRSVPSLGAIYAFSQLKRMVGKGHQGIYHRIGITFCRIKYFLILFVCIIAFLSVLSPLISEYLLVSSKKDIKDLNWEKAAQKMKRAKILNPVSASVRTELGSLYQTFYHISADSDYLNLAEREYKGALRLDSHNPARYLQLGEFFFIEYKSPSEAVSHYRKASTLDPYDPTPHIKLSNIYGLLGEFGKAKQEKMEGNHLNWLWSEIMKP